MRSDRVDFLGLEEAREFDLGVFVAVGSVDDILHHLGAEVATDRALGGLAGVSRPEQVANLGHDAVALERHHDDRTRAHETLDLGVKRLAGHVRVVLAQQRRREARHFATDDGETGLFEAAQHSTDVLLLHAIGFKDNERFLHKVANILSHPRLESPIFTIPYPSSRRSAASSVSC